MYEIILTALLKLISAESLHQQNPLVLKHAYRFTFSLLIN